ncbi:MAG TPA: CARDB domain-containing protein [Gemmataceae bacterium]|nr:CARDB domain-containing protein [Gemmataceae bacterium]
MFYASRSPSQYGAEYNLGQRPIPSLSRYNRSTNTSVLSLTGLPGNAFDGGVIYITMAINPNGTPNARDLDWLEVPVNPVANKPDLTGYFLDAHPNPDSYTWAETIRVVTRFKNAGLSAVSMPFSNGLYLSHDTTFDASDSLLYRNYFGPMAAGTTLAREFTFMLPTAPPSGFGDGPAYFLLVMDDQNTVVEKDETNNSGQGDGIDYLPVTISGSLPPPGPPVIGSFIVGPDTITRGQLVTFTATNVTDDGVVNEVVFTADSNGNGILDGGDRYIAHGSKSDTTFTARVQTDSTWAIGGTAIFAQAKDNFDNLSLVKVATLTVQAVPPFVDDAYENNDTQGSATYLGNGASVTLNGLALGPNDPDYFTFDIPNDNAVIDAEITFSQVYPPLGQPAGDLDLFLIDSNGNSVAASYYSTAGNGREHINITHGSGRFTLYVIGSNTAGFGTDYNSSYNLQLTLNAPSGYPTSGTLSASATILTRGDTLTLGVTGNTPGSNSSIYGVYWFRDSNNNGQIEGDEFIGSDEGMPDGPNGQWQTAVSTAGWSEGTTTIFSYTLDTLGRVSLANSLAINVLANQAPSIHSLATPTDVLQGTEVTLVAQGVSDDENAVTVRLYGDANANGSLDGSDPFLGNGTNSSGNWSWNVSSSSYSPGAAYFLTQAVDNRGKTGDAVPTAVTIDAYVNQPPTISSLSGPGSVVQGSSFNLQASGVADPDGTISQVTFYLDSNFDGQLDAGDLSLGIGTPNGPDWSKVIDTSDWPLGQAMLIAEAADNGSPALTAVQAFTVTVTDLGFLPRNKGTFTDQDGDTYTVRLTGPGRVGLLSSDAGADGKGPIGRIVLQDTSSTLSSLTITVQKATTGDGRISIGSIEGTGLKRLTATASDLVGNGINLSGLLGSLTIRDIRNGVDVIALGSPTQKTTIKAHDIGDGTLIDVDSAIVSLVAARFGDGAIVAPSMGSLRITGDKRANIPILGDFHADVTLSGMGVLAGKPALKSLKVAGSVLVGSEINVAGLISSMSTGGFNGTLVASSVGNLTVKGDLSASDITITGIGVDSGKPALNTFEVTGAVQSSNISIGGNVNTVSAASFKNSTFFVGYTGANDGSGIFNTVATVNTFKVTDTADAFQSSYAIATNFKNVTLKSVKTDNGGTPFGFIANLAVVSLKVLGPPTFTYKPTDGTLKMDGDFEVKIV